MNVLQRGLSPKYVSSPSFNPLAKSFNKIHLLSECHMASSLFDDFRFEMQGKKILNLIYLRESFIFSEI